MQEELNKLIEGGVQKITTLVRNTENAKTMDIESGKNFLHFLMPFVHKTWMFYESNCVFRILGKWSLW